MNLQTGGYQTRNGKGKKKPKKEDNTKLFIGLGVGGFFLLVILIAVIANGGDKAVPVAQNVNQDERKEFSLPIDVRKQIFKEYILEEEKIENASRDKTTALGADARKEGDSIRAEVNRQLYEVKKTLIEKWKKKYPEMPGNYMKTIVDEGSKKAWR